MSLVAQSIGKVLVENVLIRFIIKTLVNAGAIWLAAYYVAGFAFTGDWTDLLITGFILALANSIIKPILKFITGPLIVLTLGLFTIVVNIVILWLVAWFTPELTIIGFWAYFWGIVIISVVNTITNAITKKK